MIAVFDIGGTSIKYGLVDELKTDENGCELVIKNANETETNAKSIGGMGILNKLKQLTHEIIDREELTGIAISTAGMVDEKTGIIIYANENIPEYTGIRLKEELEKEFAVRCEVENDVNAAALGEYYYGAGRGHKSLLMLTIGTGIGGAIILDGRVLHGHSHSAGEVGYMLVDGEEFQNLASTKALVKRAEKLTGKSELNGRLIFEAAKTGDILCTQAIEEMCSILAKGIANCTYIINPEMLVLGGGIMSQEEFIRPILDKYLRNNMRNTVYKNTTVAFAKLKNQAGMIGAYCNFKNIARVH